MTVEELYRETYPIVYGYLLSLCGNCALAEDLTSETYLKAMQKLTHFDGACKPSTWLCTIGRNLFLNDCKRRRRRASLEQADVLFIPDPAEMVQQHEQVRRVHLAAESLPEISRQVFWMRVSGLGFRQIGEALGKTENWARVTYFRAKTNIRKEVEE